MSLDRHSSFTDFTQRSANEFRFGLLAGSLTVLTPTASTVCLNARQNFESRSWIKYRLDERKPTSAMVTFRATWVIQCPSGYGVMPAI